ncbi:hypothetical protein SAMN05661080_01823 [Modestobacter sp. DSM 44400]|uniref:hypothetical protein n=1 Tax=Modestobacter sp. DSM 44400 TaxID=1550230 RepID=UPI00089BC479|nr:hypothetical protein [Modestobacter sp. DSM 44400]SDX95102.1 hypothetical protein SAMN05661080_01823 [Modestobacter sp. DSM 44400]
MSTSLDAGEQGRVQRQDAVSRAASSFVDLLDAGWSLPLPGSGATLQRWRALAELGERDLPLARLAEGHADALAVLADLGLPVLPPGARLGVWAAEPPGPAVVATEGSGGWRLDGPKCWCSGARVLTGALVTAQAPDGRRLSSST